MSDMIQRVLQLQYDASKRGDLAMWTVYDHPLDFPDKIVARMFVVGNGIASVTEHLIVADDFESVADVLSNAGLTPLMRQPEDDPKITATWI